MISMLILLTSFAYAEDIITDVSSDEEIVQFGEESSAQAIDENDAIYTQQWSVLNEVVRDGQIINIFDGRCNTSR